MVLRGDVLGLLVDIYVGARELVGGIVAQEAPKSDWPCCTRVNKRLSMQGKGLVPLTGGGMRMRTMPFLWDG